MNFIKDNVYIIIFFLVLALFMANLMTLSFAAVLACGLSSGMMTFIIMAVVRVVEVIFSIKI